MKFNEIYDKGRPAISFELFPPKTEAGMRTLEGRLPRLIDLDPDLLTVTYGAMGSTRDTTLDVASKLRNEYSVEVAHHFTCVGLSRTEITATLDRILSHNIENIVALRGDPPQGETEFSPPPDGYGHANELVGYLSSNHDVGIAVAGYPEKHIEAPDFESDLANLKRKVDSGADVVVTQLFYDNSDFFSFVERCREIGITVPIVPGLMPILKTDQIKRITSLCGATIPAGLLEKLERAGDDEEKVHQVGIDHTTEQALDLLNHGAAGIHFYVLNQYFHIAEIMERIRPVATLSR